MSIFKISMNISKVLVIAVATVLLIGGCVAITPPVLYTYKKESTDEKEKILQAREQELNQRETELKNLEQKIQEEIKKFNELLMKEPTGSGSGKIDEPSTQNTSRSNSTVIHDSNTTRRYVNRQTSEVTRETPNTNIIGDDVKRQLQNAHMTFTLPRESNISKRVVAKLLISPTLSAEQLNAIAGSERRISSNVEISKIMIATITAPDFVIHDDPSKKQAISLDKPTQWEWLLEARREGELQVKLTLTAVVTVDQERTEFLVNTFTENVVIDIRSDQVITEFISKHWQWFLGTLVLPLIVWWWKNRKDSKSERY